MFEKCPRQWYYSYVKKIASLEDQSYMFAGSTIHKILEQYYRGKFKDLQSAKDCFNQLWKQYKLHESILKDSQDAYWLMYLNAINLNIKATSAEFKIFFSDVVGYIDILNTENHTILDWKSGTRREESEIENTKQLKFYSYLYNRKFGRLPNKAILAYIKYSGSKGLLEFIPTENDIKEIEEWHNNIYQQILTYRENNSVPPKKLTGCNWCPYINLCQDSEDTLKFTLNILGQYIRIDGPINPLINKALEKKFSYELKNAFFIKKARPNARTTVMFWNMNKRLLPIGFKNGVIKTLKDFGEYKNKKIAIDINDLRKFNEDKIVMPEKIVSGKELRIYQVEAADKFLQERIGMLEIATAAGKSLIMVEMIRRIGYKTLIVVTRLELLNQLKTVIENELAVEVGIIAEGIYNPKHITICTIQSITKNIKKYRDFLNTIRFSIIDECHHINMNSFWKLSHYLINTEYRIGCSGTVRRYDGNDLYLNAVNGDIIYSLNAEKLIEMGFLTKPQINFIKNYLTKEEVDVLEEKSKEGLINETPKYNLFYDNFIVNNEKRNSIVKQLVEKNKDKQILILTKRIEHARLLKELVKGELLFGATEKEVRKELLDDFKNKKINILIGTIGIFQEGLDITALNILLNLSGNKSDISSIQILGRLLRKTEEKKICEYYDFVDESRFMKSASRSRIKAFEKEGHEISIIDWIDDKIIDNY